MRIFLRFIPRWSIVAFLVLALASAGVALAAPPASPMPQPALGAEGTGYDPLSPAEAARALDAAGALRSVSAASVRIANATAGQVAVSALAEEVVLVERHQENKDVMAAGVWPRRADVYLYRYVNDTLVHALYDYGTGQMITVEEVQGVQFPLTEGERQTAIALAFADPALRAQMADEFRLITGDALTHPAQLELRVFNYHAGANPEIETPAAQACAINRCAQLLITAVDDVTLNVLPIINLSTLRVVSVVAAAATHADPQHDGSGQ